MKKRSMIVVVSSLMGLLVIFGFTINKKKVKIGDFVFIPGSSIAIKDKGVSLDSYWISAHEVTNKEYNEFLADLKNKGKTKEYEICKVHNEKWITVLGKKYSLYSEYYSSHEAYATYPVVNISHEAAKLYCEWLTENCADKTQLFRLPTKEEWIYAALGGCMHSNYSWGGNYLQNVSGMFLCNYKRIGDEYIHSDSENNLMIIPNKKDTFTSITAPVIFYWPNDYGLYNMCGNVAEMIDSNGIAMGGSWNSTGYDVQVTSEFIYDAPNPFVGFRPVRVKKN